MLFIERVSLGLLKQLRMKDFAHSCEFKISTHRLNVIWEIQLQVWSSNHGSITSAQLPLDMENPIIIHSRGGVLIKIISSPIPFVYLRFTSVMGKYAFDSKVL